MSCNPNVNSSPNGTGELVGDPRPSRDTREAIEAMECGPMTNLGGWLVSARSRTGELDREAEHITRHCGVGVGGGRRCEAVVEQDGQNKLPLR